MGTAAAAVVLLPALPFWEGYRYTRSPALALGEAYVRADLLQKARGAPLPAGRRRVVYHVGVSVDRAAFVRILTLDDRGRVESLPLNGFGEREYRV